MIRKYSSALNSSAESLSAEFAARPILADRHRPCSRSAFWAENGLLVRGLFVQVLRNRAELSVGPRSISFC
jgi:hypothetical protein